MTLLESEIPLHTHQLMASGDPADLNQPSPARSLARSGNGFAYIPGAPNATLAPEALAPAGGDQPHNNLMPYLTFYFNIALQGVFPATVVLKHLRAGYFPPPARFFPFQKGTRLSPKIEVYRPVYG